MLSNPVQTQEIPLLDKRTPKCDEESTKRASCGVSVWTEVLTSLGSGSEGHGFIPAADAMPQQLMHGLVHFLGFRSSGFLQAFESLHFGSGFGRATEVAVKRGQEEVDVGIVRRHFPGGLKRCQSVLLLAQ
jgi:hypothetical protein